MKELSRLGRRLELAAEFAKTSYSYDGLSRKVKDATGLRISKPTLDRHDIRPMCPICRTKRVEKLVRGVNGSATLGRRYYLVSAVWVCNDCIDRVVKARFGEVSYVSTNAEKASCSLSHRQERWAMSVLRLIDDALSQNIDIRTHLSYLPPDLLDRFRALGMPPYIDPRLSHPIAVALSLSSPPRFRPHKGAWTDNYSLRHASNYLTPTLSVIRCEADRILKDSIDPNSVFADPKLLAMGFGDTEMETEMKEDDDETGEW